MTLPHRCSLLEEHLLISDLGFRRRSAWTVLDDLMMISKAPAHWSSSRTACWMGPNVGNGKLVNIPPMKITKMVMTGGWFINVYDRVFPVFSPHDHHFLFVLLPEKILVRWCMRTTSRILVIGKEQLPGDKELPTKVSQKTSREWLEFQPSPQMAFLCWWHWVYHNYIPRIHCFPAQLTIFHGESPPN